MSVAGHSHSVIWGMAVFQFCLVPGDGRDIDEDGVPTLNSTTEKVSGIRLTESMRFNQDFIMKTILCLIEEGLGLPFCISKTIRKRTTVIGIWQSR